MEIFILSRVIENILCFNILHHTALFISSPGKYNLYNFDSKQQHRKSVVAADAAQVGDASAMRDHGRGRPWAGRPRRALARREIRHRAHTAASGMMPVD